MVEPRAPRLTPDRSYDIDTASLLQSLPAEQSEAVAQLVRERDHLFLLHEALIEVEFAPSLEPRLRIFVNAIRKIGFGRVTITMRDEQLNPTFVVSAGLTDEEERELRERPASGELWRRRLPLMERFRISQSWYLPGRDVWVATEFGSALPSVLEPGDDPEWSPHDSMIVPIRGRDGRIAALLMLDDPVDRRRPTLTRVRTVELFGQQVAWSIEQANLVEIAQRRAGRLQRLQDVGSRLARSLDEREILRELARQVGRVVESEGIVIAHPDIEAGRTEFPLRIVRGVERPRESAPIAGGPIAEVARTGRAVQANEYDAAALAAVGADDVLGDAATPTPCSVLAVPMMLGISLVGVIAVHAPGRGAYSAEDEEVLATIGAQAATALTNARLFSESERDRRQSEALADVARAVGESLRLGEVLNLILRHATSLLQVEGAFIALREGEYLHVVAGVGGAQLLAGLHIPLSGSLSGRVVRDAQAVIANDALTNPEMYRPLRLVANIRKTLMVPLATSRGAIGALSVINRAADFSEGDARVLQRLADLVAVAVVNARLFEAAAEATREWTVAFDANASGMVVLDEAGRIQRSNARARQLVGAESHDEIAGRDFHEALLREPAPARSAIAAEPPDDGDVLIGGAGNGGGGGGGGGVRPAAPDPVLRALHGAAVGRGTLRSAARGLIYDVVAAPHPNGGAVVTFDDVTQHHALAERYRLVLETANDAIVITDLQRRIVYANPAAHQLLGASGDLTGVQRDELVLPEAAARVRETEERVLAGEPQRFEMVIHRYGGERRTVSVSAAPLRESVGQVTGIVASLRDVSDERRARDAVAQSESRYRNLFESAEDAIYTMDAEGAFTSLNAATGELVGRPREQLVGQPILPLLDPAESDVVRGHFERALAGESSHYECHLIRPDGSRRLLSVTNTPVRQGAQVVGVLGIARDVTAERERAAALARSEARYTRLVESATDAIFTVDERGHFTSVNRSLELATGRPRESLLGASVLEVVDARDHDEVWRLFTATLAGQRQRAELRYMAASRAERTASITTTPVEEGGRVSGVLAVVRDVTEERRLVEQLLQQEKLAAMGQLVSGVAHELNNPLAAVAAFAQLLLASPDVRGDDRQAAETVQQETKRAAKIVSNLLTFARQHRPHRAYTDLNRVLLDTLELRRYALRMSRIDLDVALEPNLPPTWADPAQLQQVLLNLITNAEHSLQDWGGTRRLILRSALAGETIVVSVGDTGRGVPPDDVARIFNPFFTTKPVGEGTGLGLSISDGIVREHGGRIRVEARPGGGATFVVELPLVSAPDEAVAPAALPPPAGGSGAVLVVVAGREAREEAVRLLGERGVPADAAATGAEALARLGTRRYEAILLDLTLSDMPGDAAYQEMRRRDPGQAARVVFVTDRGATDAARAFVQATGRPSLARPFTAAALAEVLGVEER